MKTLNIFYAISAAFVMWVLVSWVDVIAHNLSTHTYFVWNAFELFGKYIIPLV